MDGYKWFWVIAGMLILCGYGVGQEDLKTTVNPDKASKPAGTRLHFKVGDQEEKDGEVVFPCRLTLVNESDTNIIELKGESLDGEIGFESYVYNRLRVRIEKKHAVPFRIELTQFNQVPQKKHTSHSRKRHYPTRDLAPGESMGFTWNAKGLILIPKDGRLPSESKGKIRPRKSVISPFLSTGLYDVYLELPIHQNGTATNLRSNVVQFPVGGSYEPPKQTLGVVKSMDRALKRLTLSLGDKHRVEPGDTFWIEFAIEPASYRLGDCKNIRWAVTIDTVDDQTASGGFIKDFTFPQACEGILELGQKAYLNAPPVPVATD